MPVVFDASSEKKEEVKAEPKTEAPVVSPPPPLETKFHPENPRLNVEDEAVKEAQEIITKHVEKSQVMKSYVANPSKVFFATQAKGETIILFLRKHPITQFGWLFLAFLLVIGPPIIFPWLGILIPLPIGDEMMLVLLLAWYLIVATFIYVKFSLWYYNVNIVSNDRVVDIDLYYLLSLEVSATRIAQVEDVTSRKIGIMSTIFDYGNVLVQTAGTEANIEFLKVPKPKLVVKTIISLMGQQE